MNENLQELQKMLDTINKWKKEIKNTLDKGGEVVLKQNKNKDLVIQQHLVKKIK